MLQIFNVLMELLDKKYYTPEEYFALVEEAELRLEYHNGEVYSMAGGTSNHNIIARKTFRQLDEKLDVTDCVVYNTDMTVKIDAYNRYVYPDCTVVCGPRKFEDENQLRLKNPILVIEVLSESTEGYDRGDKFSYYRSLPSFKEYMLLSSTKVWVETFYRESEELWRISSASNLDESIHLYSLNVDLSLRAIYAKTEGLLVG